MAAPWISAKLLHIADQSGSKRIQMDVTNQPQQVHFLLDQDGLEPVLK
jgi:hypothetical protein